MNALVQPQPAPLPSESPEVWPLVIRDARVMGFMGKSRSQLVLDDMGARAAFGRERYGTFLRVQNGRDALVDAYQEALDCAVYLRQEIERAGGALRCLDLWRVYVDQLGIVFRLRAMLFRRDRR